MTIADIVELGHTWAAAELDADADTLDRLLADDFRAVGPLGFVLDKQQWLDRYRSGDLTYHALTWRDVEVRSYGDAAVSVGTQDQEAEHRGNPVSGSFRITHVFVRQEDAWTIAGLQLSPIAAPPGP